MLCRVTALPALGEGIAVDRHRCRSVAHKVEPGVALRGLGEVVLRPWSPPAPLVSVVVHVSISRQYHLAHRQVRAEWVVSKDLVRVRKDDVHPGLLHDPANCCDLTA